MEELRRVLIGAAAVTTVTGVATGSREENGGARCISTRTTTGVVAGRRG